MTLFLSLNLPVQYCMKRSMEGGEKVQKEEHLGGRQWRLRETTCLLEGLQYKCSKYHSDSQLSAWKEFVLGAIARSSLYSLDTLQLVVYTCLRCVKNEGSVCSLVSCLRISCPDGNGALIYCSCLLHRLRGKLYCKGYSSDYWTTAQNSSLTVTAGAATIKSPVSDFTSLCCKLGFLKMICTCCYSSFLSANTFV